jgi:hypothetical protein
MSTKIHKGEEQLDEEAGKFAFEFFQHKEGDWEKLTKDEKRRWCKRAQWLKEFSKKK